MKERGPQQAEEVVYETTLKNFAESHDHAMDKINGIGCQCKVCLTDATVAANSWIKWVEGIESPMKRRFYVRSGSMVYIDFADADGVDVDEYDSEKAFGPDEGEYPEHTEDL